MPPLVPVLDIFPPVSYFLLMLLLSLCGLLLAQSPNSVRWSEGADPGAAPPPSPPPDPTLPPEDVPAVEHLPTGVDLSTPQSTFLSLVQAIRGRDIESYTACFAPERARVEGMVDHLAADPREWEELQGIFRGPQKLKLEGDPAAIPVGGKLGATVKAPRAAEGGIGSVTFLHTEAGWVVWSW